MPPKKRSSSGSKPPSKVPARAPVCHFGTEKNPCRAECASLKEFYTGKEVRLCPAHRKCLVCRKDVESGQFALWHRYVACLLPSGTPNRLESMCAFRCAQCYKVFLKGQELWEEQYEGGAGDDEDLFCERCSKGCVFCGGRTGCHPFRYRGRALRACADCDPEERPEE